MWSTILSEAHAVLLVGECNFSFSVSLLEIIDKPTIITSTCLETDPEEQPRKENMKLLREKGVRILLGVDATKLKENQDLEDKYDCIIFNFPHIGGKSRIHLNRELLHSFFVSASSCLDEREKNSCVIVTLCQGQGGILCDLPRHQRAYGDTWKVVEMAAYGGLILKRVENFQAKLFPGYTPSGYGKRGEKGFHIDDSLTYVFCKSRPHRIGLPLGNDPFTPESLRELLLPDSVNTHFGTISCSRVHSSLYNRRPLASAPITYVVQYLMKQVKVKKVIDADEEVPLNIDRTMDVNTYICGDCSLFFPKCKRTMALATCMVDGSPSYLRDSLVYAFKYVSASNSVFLIKGCVFRHLGETISLPPVGAEAVFCGEGSMDAVLSVLTKLSGGPGHCVLKLVNTNNSRGRLHDELVFNLPTFEIISLDQMLVLGHVFCGFPEVGDVCTVNLDSVALLMFNATDWREIRAKGCRVLNSFSMTNHSFQDECLNSKNKQSVQCEKAVSKQGVTFIPESLYPPTFTLDVCFSEIGIYSEKEFWHLLWHLVGDVVISVELIDTYHPTPERVAIGHRTSWCFRLKYCSYEWPLQRKSAVKIQNEVLHWGLVNILGVSVK